MLLNADKGLLMLTRFVYLSPNFCCNRFSVPPNTRTLFILGSSLVLLLFTLRFGGSKLNITSYYSWG